MHGLKSAILTIFQKSTDWLDWPCPVSAALQNSSKDFFPLLYLYLFFLNETIVRSNAWSFGHSDPDPSSVLSLSRWSFPLLIDFGRQYSKFLDLTRQTEITVYFFNQGQMIKSYFSKLLETKTENFLFPVYRSISWAWRLFQNVR